MTAILHLDFYSTLTENNQVLPYYKSLSINNGIDIFAEDNQFQNEISKTISVKLFPLYLFPNLHDVRGLEIKKVPQKKIIGYAIDLKNIKTIDDFLTQEYSKSFRANIRRLKKRFEECFTVSYRMFYGKISKEKYNLYMSELHKMLTIRFDQRNESNDILENWDFYLDSTYNLINQKKASIFVIYENNIPVHICINHHFNNLLFVSIPSYDIDYSKFALGNISIYKLLEWAIENNYAVLDMAYGTLEYKRRWSNFTYDFEHHILYDKTVWLQRIGATVETKKIQFKNFLKRYNIDEHIKKLKNLKNRKNTTYIEIEYQLSETRNINVDRLTEINIYSFDLQNLKKIVFDFLYAEKLHIEKVKVFKTDSENQFIINTPKKNYIVALAPNL